MNCPDCNNQCKDEGYNTIKWRFQTNNSRVFWCAVCKMHILVVVDDEIAALEDWATRALKSYEPLLGDER